jgi:hypothetical protein
MTDDEETLESLRVIEKKRFMHTDEKCRVLKDLILNSKNPLKILRVIEKKCSSDDKIPFYFGIHIVICIIKIISDRYYFTKDVYNVSINNVKFTI